MVESKYRGRRVDTYVILGLGEWVYGSLVIRNCDGYPREYIYNSSVDETEIYECGEDAKVPLSSLFIPVHPDTVGQYITKDRKDNDIYTGSRVKLFGVPSDAQEGIVVYDDEEAMFRVDVGTEEYCPFIPKEVEVISEAQALNKKGGE